MMTSEFEGLPVALLEAMSMECAVVCTDAGGIKEVIRISRMVSCCLFRNGKNWKHHFSNLIQNKALIRTYGEKARRRKVQESFSLKAMVQETEDAYEAIQKSKIILNHGNHRSQKGRPASNDSLAETKSG